MDSAPDHQILLAIDDEEVAVLIDPGYVAGAEPALGVDGFGGGLGAMPVALHHVVAPDLDLAGIRFGDGALAKLNNTRKARQVITEACDLLGGSVIHTYEGTETMQTLIVGRDITGVGAFV